MLYPLRFGALVILLQSLLAPAALADNALSLMTVNLKHKDVPEELATVARRLKLDTERVPDFVLCQEVMFQRSGRDENTAAVLAREMGYYVRGTKRTSDREGVAIVSRYPFENYFEQHLASQTARLLLGFRRVSVMGEFLVPEVGRVRVVNVHLTNWPWEGHVRRKQIAETLAWMETRQREAPAVLTFLGGDFNAEFDDPEMKQIAAARYEDYNTRKSHKGYVGSMGSRRIDLIFVAAHEQPARLARERVLWADGLRHADGREFDLSDHRAVYQLYRLDTLTAGNRAAALGGGE